MKLLFFMLASTWLRLETPYFEVVTDAKESAAREVLDRLEGIRQAIGDEQSNPLPVRVYLFRTEKEFVPFRPSAATSGFYQSGPDRDLIVMYASGDPGHVVFHEFVHITLHHSGARMPQWFEEGIAELYSTLEISGSKLRIGRPVPQHTRTLEQSTWLTAEEMWGVNKSSAQYNEREKAGIFYAQSWALVHLLCTSPDYRGKVREFSALIEAGNEGQHAFQKAFGRTLARALQDVRATVEARRFPYQEEQRSFERAPVPTQRVLAREEADLLEAELYLALGKPEPAGAIYTRLTKSSKYNAEVEAGLGSVAMAFSEYDQARLHLQRAIKLGNHDAATHFEYAMLLRESGAPLPAIQAALQRTLALNPKHVEAHFVLANMLSAEGNPTAAIPHLKQAIEVLPRQSQFWHALAIAYLDSNQRTEAASAAKHAADSAATPQEADMAADLLRMLQKQ